jgi:hypothetical protein
VYKYGGDESSRVGLGFGRGGSLDQGGGGGRRWKKKEARWGRGAYPDRKRWGRGGNDGPAPRAPRVGRCG